MIIMILAALTMIPIFGLWGFLELKHIVKKEYIIESPDIPESLNGKKLALISDQHGIFQGEDNKRVFDILDNVGKISGHVIFCRRYRKAEEELGLL
ncbi:MAG: hypothetical protein IKH42_04915 [Lachnospiraceae bacterium]|nr:hypothetical protein [Lachnospiraceae bacterium]